jgi:hypothetical protein
MLVSHTQRRFAVPDDDGTVDAARDGGGAPNPLHGILFQPIAGDALANVEPQGASPTPMMTLESLQFGILAARTIRAMSVAAVTSPATTDAAGCLNDLRMGANSARNQPCLTCNQLRPRAGSPSLAFRRARPSQLSFVPPGT